MTGLTEGDEIAYYGTPETGGTYRGGLKMATERSSVSDFYHSFAVDSASRRR